MLSIILSVILFFITIPLKTVELGLKVGVRATGKLAKKAKEEMSGNGDGQNISNELKARLDSVSSQAKKTVKSVKNVGKATGKAAKATYKTAKLAVKTTKFAIKLAIAAIKLVILVIKLIAAVLAVLGVIGVILLLLLIFLVVAIIGSYMSIGLFDGVGSSGQQQQTESGTSLIDANHNIVIALREMANSYISQVIVYDQGLYTDVDSINGSVRADCTGFAQAVFRLVINETGVNDPQVSKIPLNTSKVLCKQPGEEGSEKNNWLTALPPLGFACYTSNEMTLEDLQEGDCLVAYGHAAFYVDETHQFGWGGDGITAYPRGGAFSYDSANHCFKMSGSDKKYTMIYRYIGTGSGSSLDEESSEESTETAE